MPSSIRFYNLTLLSMPNVYYLIEIILMPSYFPDSFISTASVIRFVLVALIFFDG